MLFVNVVEDGTIFSKFCEENYTHQAVKHAEWKLTFQMVSTAYVSIKMMCIMVCRNHFHYCASSPLHNEGPEGKNTAPEDPEAKLPRVSETYECMMNPALFGRNLLILGRSLLICSAACAANTCSKKCSECQHHFFCHVP